MSHPFWVHSLIKKQHYVVSLYRCIVSCLIAFLALGTSCEKSSESLDVLSVVVNPDLTREAAISQEVKNRLFFLENEIGLENLDTETFPSAYAGLFDLKTKQSKNGVEKVTCGTCNYVPSSCDEFDLYIRLLYESCLTNDAGPVDFCSLWEDCKKCRDETCGSPDPDPCENISCPTGTTCNNGVCVAPTPCEIATATVEEYIALSDEEIIRACGFTGTVVPSRWSRELWRCPLFLDYNDALSVYLKQCSDGTCDGCP